MANVTANSSQDINLVTGVLVESTSNPEELSMEGQVGGFQESKDFGASSSQIISFGNNLYPKKPQ